MDSTAPTTPFELPRRKPAARIPFARIIPAREEVSAKIEAIARRSRPLAQGELQGVIVGGRYRLGFLLGRGGMSVVYLGRCLDTGRHVAVKLLRAELVDRSPYRQRFLNEVEAVRRIQHPVIVRMLDVGEMDDGRIYLVMELVRGPSLKRLLEVRSPPLAEVLKIASAVADGLGAAHAHGVIHRDLKPGNVLIPRLAECGVPAKIVDFGIARIDGYPKITNTAEVVGTPLYLSPEQAMGRPIDHRADVYCFGVMLYEACTGARLFDGKDPQLLLRKHVRCAPVPMRKRRPDLVIPRALDELVLACLEKPPSRRPGSMEEIAAVLRVIAARVLAN